MFKYSVSVGILLLIFCGTSGIMAQDFVWAKRFGGTNSDEAYDVAVDTGGNVCTVGRFFGTVDFDPGPGTSNLTPTVPIANDAFVSKLDGAGNFVWARHLDGNFVVEARGVVVDVSGNIYTAGQFLGTADFDPGVGSSNLTSSDQDAFVVKLDAAGNLVWAKQVGGSSVDLAFDVALDSGGNLLVAGIFSGVADFDPGPGTFNLTAASLEDVFILKLDAAGNFIWAKRLGGLSDDFVAAVAVDSSDNAYVAGYFKGTADFDPSGATFNLTSAGAYDVFVCKFDSMGAFVWAKRLGGTADDQAHGIAVDSGGSTFTVGPFSGTADFDPGPGTFNLTSDGSSDAFVCRLDGLGNLVWAKKLGGTSNQTAYDVARDGAGNVFTVGFFSGITDFDPGPGIYNLAGSNNVFVSRLDAAGTFIGAEVLSGGSTSNAADGGVTVDGDGNLYTVGPFSGTVDFDPGPGTHNLTSAGMMDVFVTKLALPAGAGAVPDGASVRGVPLRLAKAGADLTLTWSASCSTAAVDYEVYEGALGVYTSHTPLVCSTSGATSMTVSPSSGDRYYLVVPTTEVVEGSYGQSSESERSASLSACLPQNSETCF